MKSQSLAAPVVSLFSKVFNRNRSTKTSVRDAGWTLALILMLVTLLALFGSGKIVSSQEEKPLGLNAAMLGGPVNPGGVTGQSLWVKADLGLQVNASQQVEQWLDQSGSGNTTTQLRASLPAHTNAIAPSNAILRVANGINFNPAVDFTGATGRSLKGNAVTRWDTDPVSIFGVASPEGAPGGVFGAIWDANANWTTGAVGTAGIGLDISASAYSLDGNGCSTAQTTSPVNGPNVVRGVYTNPLNNLGGSTWLNGVQEGTGSNCGTAATTFFEVGGRTAGDPTFDTRIFNGKIPEVVVYKRVLTAAEANRVDSYLAIKYGVTLRQTPAPQNYTASDGTTAFWDASVNTVYNKNITGIGRDDTSGLDQKQSRSVNLPGSGNMVTMGLTTIAADNASNPNTFGADKDFLTWGDDGAVASFNTLITPPVGVLATVRTTRIWKAQETGTVGTVKVGIPANLGGGNVVYLVVSGDTTFDATDQYVPMTPLTAGSTTYQAADFDFTTGQFFAFATLPAIPGGVGADLALWVKANDGLEANGSDQVQQWFDQSISGVTTELRAAHPAHTDAITPTNDILRVGNGINFNPAVDFTGASGRSLKGDASTEWDTGGLSVFAVSAPEGVSGGPNISGAIWDSLANWTTDPSAGGAGLLLDQAQTSYGLDSDGIITALTTSPVAQPRVARAVYTNATNTLGGTTWLDGVQEGTGVNRPTSVTTLFEVGGRTAGTTTFDTRIFNGKITEVVVYKSVLSAANANMVESYLAVKYGITLRQTPAPQNYTASDGTVIWDSGINAAYNDDIAGIGRDDVSALNQKQSASVNAGNFLTIGHGIIAVDNESNPNSFPANKDFLIWGHDAGATTFNVPVTGASAVRMERIWKVQETAGVPLAPEAVTDVVVRVPQSLFGAGPPVLIRSVDATFDVSDEFISMTANGTDYEATIDFNDADFFTFGRLVPTAANVSISGRVTTADGRGLPRASVILTDMNGNSRTATTSVFGYFLIDDVRVGETYILTAVSKGYQFEQQTISVLDEMSGLDFVALE